MNISVTGFNGERIDPVSGHSHLGNGYRAYSPALMRFTCPDNLSPFGDGGINPYAYCAGDPVNHADPTGHLSWQAWLGIGMGIAGLAGAVYRRRIHCGGSCGGGSRKHGHSGGRNAGGRNAGMGGGGYRRCDGDCQRGSRG